MSLVAYSGIPGSGKTLNATIRAVRYYKKTNSKLKYIILKLTSPISKASKEKLEYYKLFKHKKINNIYSTYPILLDKKHKIYSYVISLWDLNNNYSFLPDSLIIIDESQLFCDADEYKDKKTVERLRPIGYFLQAHRHFGIKEIILTSQDPDRIFKKARNICSSYIKFKRTINLPIIPLSYCSGVGYYNLKYYGEFIPRDYETRRKLPFDYYKYRMLFIRTKYYKSYDSRYLSPYNYTKPLINLEKNVNTDSLKLSYNYLTLLFEYSVG